MKVVSLVLVAVGIVIHSNCYAPTTPQPLIVLSPRVYRNPVLELRMSRVLKAIILTEKPKTKQQARDAERREQAVGILQIRPIMVAEVNRLLGYDKYRLSDRRDSIKSVEMFNVYQNHYNDRWIEKRASYLWVGGSNYSNATYQQWIRMQIYWHKVNNHLIKMK